MRRLSLALALFLSSGVAVSQEVSEAKLVEIGNRVVDAVSALDYAAFHNLMTEELRAKQRGDDKSDAEREAEWTAEIKSVLDFVGKIQKLELEELDPPDGAFFKIHFERGTAEMFLVVDAEGKITEMNIRMLEHPEHPEEGGEHPEEGAEHPEEGAEHPVEQKPVTIEEVAEFLEGHVAEETAAQGGWMKILDEKLGTDLRLQLDKVHRERLAKTGHGTYFVCADFNTPEGKVYDLDFWVKETADGLSVTEVTIHKEEGEPRYNWVEESGVWKRQPL